MIASNSVIKISLAIAGLTTAAITVLVFMDNKKHKKLSAEVLSLEKEIKELQLSGMKSNLI